MKNYDRRPIFPPNCSWCGHDPHSTACPGELQTGTAKDPKVIACPCKREKQP